jgi:CO dehydrogenase maturation factor
MKIAFVGKGGSGKTTVASLFARHLAARGLPVLAIDADINQHLGAALGQSDEEAAAMPAMGNHLNEIKDYLRGTNPRIRSAATMVKTTPPGTGSRLVGVTDSNPIYERLSRHLDEIRLLATGPFAEDDLGVACYHAKVGAVELLLNHMIDGPGEYVVVDMTAGADAFASGMFTRFDRTFLVAEPTRKAVSVYRQYRCYADDHDVAISVVGNKINGQDDVAFLRREVGEDLLVCIEYSPFVLAAEQGRPLPLNALETANQTALERMREAVDTTPKNWPKFYRQTIEFHQKNVLAWANAQVGEDLTTQVDPDFMLDPEMLKSTPPVSQTRAEPSSEKGTTHVTRRQTRTS